MKSPTPPSDAKKYSTFSCPNQHCPLFQQVGAGNITHRSWTGKEKAIERLRCTVCGQEFSERRGTLMEATKLPEATVERLLKCQRWGVCDEGTADICEVDIKTVHRFQKVAARRAQEHHEHVARDLKVEGVQLDKMRSKLRGNRIEWLHTAIDMWSLFLLWVHFGPRTQESAAVLIAQVVARRRRRSRRRHPKPILVPPADLFYAQVVKVGDATGTLVQVVRRVIFGGPRRFFRQLAERGLGQTIQTAFMERWYGTLRGLCPPLRRRTRCGSASVARHRGRIWLFVDLCNFVLPHKSLRQQGKPRPWRLAWLIRSGAIATMCGIRFILSAGAPCDGATDPGAPHPSAGALLRPLIFSWTTMDAKITRSYAVGMSS